MYRLQFQSCEIDSRVYKVWIYAEREERRVAKITVEEKTTGEVMKLTLFEVISTRERQGQVE